MHFEIWVFFIDKELWRQVRPWYFIEHLIQIVLGSAIFQ